VSPAFQPWASSFTSATTGFVLGGVGCRFGANGAQQRCRPVVVATSDEGRTWRRVAAPSTSLQWSLPVRGGTEVRAITFADSRDGWLYGAGLWATHDGGAHWTPTGVNGLVMSVAASGAWAYAAVEKGGGFGAQSPALLRSPVGRDDWQPVRSLTGTVAYAEGSLLLAGSGGTVWAGIVPTATQASAKPVLWRSVNGAAWQRLGNPCASGSLASLTAGSASDFAMLCAGSVLQIATSTDGALHTQRSPGPEKTGAGLLAAALGTDKTLVLAYPSRIVLLAGSVSPSQGGLERTTDGGRTWTPYPLSNTAVGWADLQFPSPSIGWVIQGYPGARVDRLLRTTNGGATFAPVRF
jgi:hypothetical protein